MPKSKFYHIQALMVKICKDSCRDNPKIFQKYLCVAIFPCWNEFYQYYNQFCKEKYDNIEHFLSALFEIDYIKTQSILKQLELYKNYKI